ncbi:hypothetical protein EVAR_90430_1 [Eumeta japonica]|uniref:Uncharacterized protein n=1 Tax=Eumeta variegata TaxID=151549 RepID=A0A4C1YAE3_EUMVA|nr:hypothetical protein EVAR_90430_1 [Eumeta japonica]
MISVAGADAKPPTRARASLRMRIPAGGESHPHHAQRSAPYGSSRVRCRPLPWTSMDRQPQVKVARIDDPLRVDLTEHAADR